MISGSAVAGAVARPLRDAWLDVALCVVLALGAVGAVLPGSAIAEQASGSDLTSVAAAAGLDAGGVQSCSLLASGSVRCWGYGGDGELGYGNTDSVGDDETPASAGPVDLGSGLSATAISAGDFHTCAILVGGSVRCWGFGGDGRLGYGNLANVGDTQAPGSVGPVDLGTGPLGTPHTAVAISAGGSHTCAILDDGSVRCWGYGADGQLGYGNPDSIGDNETPGSVGPVDLAGHKAVAISAGGRHTCAILDDGTVRCWGYGAYGQLGYGNTSNVGNTSLSTPATVGSVNLGAPAIAISAGQNHTCAILSDRTVRCWGYGSDGELGYGNRSSIGATPLPTPGSVGPVDLGGHKALAISAGQSHTCAVLDDHSVRCWGLGVSGRLGYGNTNNVGDYQTPGSVGPVDLGPGRSAAAISAGGRHTCARLDDGSVRCWGYGAYGRLGYCNESNVGDTQTPGSVGPVNLFAGDGGTLCPVPVTPVPVSAVPVSVSPPSVSGRAVQGQTLTEAPGSWSNGPTSYAYQWERCDAAGANCAALPGAAAQTYTLTSADVASTIRVQETASNAAGAGVPASSTPTAVVTATVVAASDAARARGFRACLASVSRRARRDRAQTRRGSSRQRARARRRLASHLRTGRARCVALYGRTPGQVTALRALARSKTRIELDFLAVGTDGSRPPAAQSYLIKQSLRPIRNQRDFARAHALCHGRCRFTVQVGGSGGAHGGGGGENPTGGCSAGPAKSRTLARRTARQAASAVARNPHARRAASAAAETLQIGTCVSLTITNLKPHTTFYYSIVALDNVTGRRGPRSRTVKARTA